MMAIPEQPSRAKISRQRHLAAQPSPRNVQRRLYCCWLYLRRLSESAFDWIGLFDSVLIYLAFLICTLFNWSFWVDHNWIDLSEWVWLFWSSLFSSSYSRMIRRHEPTTEWLLGGYSSGRHGSVVLSAPSILRLQVRIPITPSRLLQFVLLKL